MKKILKLVAVAAVMVGSSLISELKGQTAEGGVLVYSLPNTSLHLEVEALKEVYTPGPYAKFAKKYLGITVEGEASEKYHLKTIKVTPYLEADMSKRYVINLNGVPNITETFFKMTSQGIVVLSDNHIGGGESWRFPTLVENDSNAGVEATNNFTSVETTLYKNVRNSDGGFDKVAIQQSQVVEKSLEKKAQEIANQIFSLRQQRVQIITGDTDATFSGEALGAAIAEITRLEQSYLSLFMGKVEYASQKMSFDLVPESSQERQLSVAFRMSETSGIMMSDNVSGRPIVMEIIPEVAIPAQVDLIETSDKKVKKPNLGEIQYRVPAICVIKITDGQELLLQARMPIYQMGQTISLPASIIK